MNYEPGYYNCRAIPESFQLSPGEPRKDGSIGAPRIGIFLQLLDDNEQPFGEPVQTILYLSRDAAPYSVERLQKLGMTNDDITEPVGLGSVVARVQAKEDTWDDGTGNQKVSLKWEVSTLDRGMAFKNTLQGPEKSVFAASFKGLFGGAAKPATATKAPQASSGFTPKTFA